MTEAILKYDEMADTLYITFVPGKKATGIALNDQLLLRVDKQTRQAVYNGPKNLDSQMGKNKVLTNHAQTI